MSIKVAIIGLGIMGTRMLTHMRLHEKFKPDYLWDPNPKACENALKLDNQCSIMKSAEEAIENADLVYLACPPTVRESYAMKVVEMGKALFLEKPFGINIQESKNFIDKLKKFDVPIAVNFTQAGGAPLSDLLESKDKGEMGEMLGADIIVTYSKWPREWQKEADWLRFKKEGGMTREVISHFIFFIERVLGPLKVKWAQTSYPSDTSLCETDVLAKLETENGLPVNILASVGGVQPDRQEFTIKGSRQSRKIEEFHKDSLSTGNQFVPLRDEEQDPRAVSLRSQLDALFLKINNKPNSLATIDEAFRVQKLVEEILSQN
jgi:predicted dehydrogenase